MSHRRSHSLEIINPFSWENKADTSRTSWEKNKPRISKERSSWNKPWASKDRPRISWENKPWISKERSRLSWENKTERSPKVAPERDALGLPLPPCRLESGRRPVHVNGHHHVRLPPCSFQPPGTRASPKKGVRREEDPFLAAYMECTKSVKGAKESKRPGLGFGFGFGFSCKNSCGVRDDGMVRISLLHAAHPREWLLGKEMKGGGSPSP